MTEEEILNTLDHCNDGYYCTFIELGHPYCYLVDSRLNVFRADDGRWALVAEKLGFNPRGGYITLEIYFFGNCLFNLDSYNDHPVNMHTIYPVEEESFEETTDSFVLFPEASFWNVRGQLVPLSHDKQDYADAGIELKEYEPDTIGTEEAARLVVSQNRDLFRATDSELYLSIPADLKKIMVLDEWFHKDFSLPLTTHLTDGELRQTWELNKTSFERSGLTFEDFVASCNQQYLADTARANEIWENDRPSAYETWPLLAKVLVTNDLSHYKPLLKPNTHWKNWPESGSL